MGAQIVPQIAAWSKIYRDAADRALDAAASAAAANPNDAAKQLDFKQSVQNHSTVLSNCSDMLTAAMQIVAADAAKTLGAINDGTNQLAAVLDKIAAVQKVVDILADLVTTTADVVTAVTTLDPSKVVDAANDLKTLVSDTIGSGSGGDGSGGGGS